MSKMPGPKHLLPSRRHCSFSMVPTGCTVSRWPAIRMPGSPCFGCGKRARTQPAKPWRPAMRSMVAPMIAISRAARSSMRSTAAASQVGLSHSTQLTQPLQHGLGIEGQIGWVHWGCSRFLMACFWRPSLTKRNGAANCKAKTRHGMMSPATSGRADGWHVSGLVILPQARPMAGCRQVGCRTWPGGGTVSILPDHWPGRSCRARGSRYRIPMGNWIKARARNSGALRRQWR